MIFIYLALLCIKIASFLLDTDAFKTGKPSAFELDKLAGEIGDVWERLGTHLNIPLGVLQDIAANAKDKPLKMLHRWINTTTSASPYHDLYDALCDKRVGRNDLAKGFCCKETM